MRTTALAAALAGLLTIPASAQPQRDEGLPAPARAEAGAIDLGARIDEALAFVRDPRRFHAGNAEAVMAAGYEDLLRLDPARLDWDRIDADPEGLNRRVFALVLAIDDRMADLHRQGAYTDDVANAKRRVLRGLRFLRERLLMRAADRTPERLYAGGRPALASEPPPEPGFDRFHWTVRPGWADRPLEAGSWPRTFFILNEGDMTLSAAISRSATEDNMFSHYSIGYISDREHTIEGETFPAGTVFTIEALIERGVVIHPFPYHFEEALTDWSVREAFFVLRDPAAQAAVDRAADAFFERVRDALHAGEPLGYDFSMGARARGLAGALAGEAEEAAEAAEAEAPRLLSMRNFFCSGVAEALGEAAGVELFTNRTRLEQGPNTSALVAGWGADPSAAVPAPGDGDVSATLLRVAEGARIERLRVTHHRHAILDRMFTWMDRDDYVLTAPATLVAGARVVSGLNEAVEGTLLDLGLVPAGITPSITASTVPIHLTAEAYLERLAARDAEVTAARGRALTPTEMAAYLERIRPEVDVDRFFARSAAGRYTLDSPGPLWTPDRRVDLEVTRAAVQDEVGAVRFDVARVVRDAESDRVVGRGAGAGVQRGARLVVRFGERAGAQPERIVYRFARDGAILGRPGPFRRERGSR